MAGTNDSFKVSIREFVGSRQSHLFKTLKIPQYSGQIVFNSLQGQEWVFDMYLGRITYATGGRHPCRRWIRNVNKFAPDCLSELSRFNRAIFETNQFMVNWEYNLLRFLLKENLLNPSQVKNIISGIVTEILFDMTQAMEITFDMRSGKELPQQLAFIDADSIIVEVWQDWQDWQGARLADRSPNRAPVIRQSDDLKQKTSPKTYQIMSKLFNGRNTLRDLHIQLNQDLVTMTKMMTPYFQLGLIELVTVGDTPFPWLNIPKKAPVNGKKAVVICISTELVTMERIKATVTHHNYTFMSYNHGEIALASIAQKSPQFIFIDLDMNSISAYELVAEIKKLPNCQQIPIVIITSQVERVEPEHIEQLGFSNVLAKPIKSQSLLDIMIQHLHDK